MVIDPDQVYQLNFSMKIIALTIPMRRTSPQLVTPNISRWKEKLSQKLNFPENTTAFTLLSKVPQCTNILMQHSNFSPTIWKPMAPVFQNTLTLDQYLFNSRSNTHVNLVHWNSLHPKKAILFTGQIPHFLCENHNTRTSNLHLRNAVFVLFF